MMEVIPNDTVRTKIDTYVLLIISLKANTNQYVSVRKSKLHTFPIGKFISLQKIIGKLLLLGKIKNSCKKMFSKFRQRLGENKIAQYSIKRKLYSIEVQTYPERYIYLLK